MQCREPGCGYLEEDYVELGRQISVINRHREEAGRSGLPFEINGLAKTMDDIKRAVELGVTSIYTGPDVKADAKKDYFVDWIKRYADETIAKV